MVQTVAAEAAKSSKWVTIQGAADIFGVHVNTVRFWIERGTVPVLGYANKVAVLDREYIERMAEKRKQSGKG
jgi:predicted site-specific integrase-resolvase